MTQLLGIFLMVLALAMAVLTAEAPGGTGGNLAPEAGYLIAALLLCTGCLMIGLDALAARLDGRVKRSDLQQRGPAKAWVRPGWGQSHRVPDRAVAETSPASVSPGPSPRRGDPSGFAGSPPKPVTAPAQPAKPRAASPRPGFGNGHSGARRD